MNISLLALILNTDLRFLFYIWCSWSDIMVGKYYRRTRQVRVFLKRLGPEAVGQITKTGETVLRAGVFVARRNHAHNL